MLRVLTRSTCRGQLARVGGWRPPSLQSLSRNPFRKCREALSLTRSPLTANQGRENCHHWAAGDSLERWGNTYCEGTIPLSSQWLSSRDRTVGGSLAYEKQLSASQLGPIQFWVHLPTCSSRFCSCPRPACIPSPCSPPCFVSACLPCPHLFCLPCISTSLPATAHSSLLLPRKKRLQSVPPMAVRTSISVPSCLQA